MELCPMWDIYGERWNCHRKLDCEKFFLVIVKCHKCRTKCHTKCHTCDREREKDNVVYWKTKRKIKNVVSLVTFSVRKMEDGLWKISVRTDPEFHFLADRCAEQKEDIGACRFSIVNRSAPVGVRVAIGLKIHKFDVWGSENELEVSSLK